MTVKQKHVGYNLEWKYKRVELCISWHCKSLQPSAYVPASVWKTILTPTKKRQNFSSVILVFMLRIANWITHDSAPNNSKQSLASICSTFIHESFCAAYRYREITMYLVFLACTSRPVSLPEIIKDSLLVYITWTFPPNILTSSALIKSRCLPSNLKPFWFASALLMAHSTAKLKISDDKASPCFTPFSIRNMTDPAPTRIPLYVPITHISIALTSVMAMPNPIRMLHKTSLLTES